MVHLDQHRRPAVRPPAHQPHFPRPPVRVAPLGEERVDGVAERAGDPVPAQRDLADPFPGVRILVRDPVRAPPPAARPLQAPAQLGHGAQPGRHRGAEVVPAEPGGTGLACLEQDHRAGLLAEQRRLRMQEQGIFGPQRTSHLILLPGGRTPVAGYGVAAYPASAFICRDAR
jgi:hypothetical protein